MTVLVTGGTGYIGSHTVVELLENKIKVIVIDNFTNSKREVVDRIKKITGKDFIFYEKDVCDKEALRKIFQKHSIDAVIHFAGYKAVGESVKDPLKYYQNNLFSTIQLLQVMDEADCRKLVFSSSATVYGNPKTLPIKEDFPLLPTNPYGTTKWMIEQILRDIAKSNSNWSIAILRYFNSIGAHPSGLLGEDPNGIPNNLMPYIMKVANHELRTLNVFGDDYNTKDGTGVRDYIHVVDLAKGHLKALDKIDKTTGVDAYNLGTGIGYSVLEMSHTFEKVNGVKINYQITARRPGDIDLCYADASYAEKELGWKAEKSLEDMCRDAYHYIVQNKK